MTTRTTATPITSRVKYTVEVQIQPINEILRRLNAADPDLLALYQHVHKWRKNNLDNLADKLESVITFYRTAGRPDRFCYVPATVEVEHFHDTTTFNLSHDDLYAIATAMPMPDGAAKHRDDLLAIFNALD